MQSGRMAQAEAASGCAHTGKPNRMTSASLKEKPVRDLARLAKQHGVAGWHAMRKDQLIRALVRKARARPPVAAATRSTAIPLPSNGRGGRRSGMRSRHVEDEWRSDRNACCHQRQADHEANRLLEL